MSLLTPIGSKPIIHSQDFDKEDESIEFLDVEVVYSSSFDFNRREEAIMCHFLYLILQNIFHGQHNATATVSIRREHPLVKFDVPV